MFYARRVLSVAAALVFALQPNTAFGNESNTTNFEKPMHVFIYRETEDLLASGFADLRNRLAANQKVDTSKINWREFDDSLFEEAKRTNKFVLLDLEAVWCHWCHVMDKKTYSDDRVVSLINSKFIAVKVDQDSRPDLSHKYEDYGWPATIIFNSDGQEIVKRSGYINPDRMLKLLQAIIDDPSPEEDEPKPVSFNKKGVLDPALKKVLISRHEKGYDSKYGGWGRFHKFLDWDSVEYAMEMGLTGDKAAEKRARQTLTAQLNLLDPVWGGVYQYSTDGDWQHPHFEKIMQMQAENMRVYSLGYTIYKDQKFLKAAKEIARYLNDTLSSEDGAFYTSQDADLEPGKHSSGYFDLGDKERRAQGIPRIDKSIYTRENGWAINAFAHLYMATGDKRYLDRAVKAADWIIANRSLKRGGFSHGKDDKAGPYLGDSLAIGRAFLSLYQSTAERKWLKRAEQAAQFIDAHFRLASNEKGKAGFVTADLSSSKVAKPVPLPDENAMLARFANLLFHYSGVKKYSEMASEALRYVASPSIAKRRKILVAGPLLADFELSREPVHVTVVGSKRDALAKALFMAAIQGPSIYKRVEWYDKREGKLPNTEVKYPDLKKAAAFSCGDGRCSLPAFNPGDVKSFFSNKTM